MKILHTSDWHIGQFFHEYDRTYEHQHFLDWLVKTLAEEQIDSLLISGDVFDLSNPSAVSIKMFYSFLNQATKENPDLQIIVTAGNHDSAYRLESPKPLLESSNIHIVGFVEKDEVGDIDYEKLIIPLNDKEGNIKVWCLAVPFLRMGDYPIVQGCDDPYVEGVTLLYKNVYQNALQKKQSGQSIIAIGHLHAQQTELSDMDKIERQIMGGVECVSATAFDGDISYVALGHIHKAQRIGGKEHIRYCGSPLPMSFSEINYKHQVVVFELEGESIQNLKTVEVPVAIPLLKVPAVHSSLEGVLDALSRLETTDGDHSKAPYLQVPVLLDGPEPGLRYKIETALSGKYVRLATIDVRYKANSSPSGKTEIVSPNQLNDLKPIDVLSKVYQAKYDGAVPEDLLKLFHQVSHEVSQNEALK